MKAPYVFEDHRAIGDLLQEAEDFVDRMHYEMAKARLAEAERLLLRRPEESGALLPMVEGPPC